jgi:hypothetical protein
MIWPHLRESTTIDLCSYHVTKIILTIKTSLLDFPLTDKILLAPWRGKPRRYKTQQCGSHLSTSKQIVSFLIMFYTFRFLVHYWEKGPCRDALKVHQLLWKMSKSPQNSCIMTGNDPSYSSEEYSCFKEIFFFWPTRKKVLVKMASKSTRSRRKGSNRPKTVAEWLGMTLVNPLKSTAVSRKLFFSTPPLIEVFGLICGFHTMDGKLLTWCKSGFAKPHGTPVQNLYQISS